MGAMVCDGFLRNIRQADRNYYDRVNTNRFLSHNTLIHFSMDFKSILFFSIIPTAVLQLWHNKPRILPVEWSWSTCNHGLSLRPDSVAPHKPQRPSWVERIAKYCSSVSPYFDFKLDFRDLPGFFSEYCLYVRDSHCLHRDLRPFLRSLRIENESIGRTLLQPRHDFSAGSTYMRPVRCLPGFSFHDCLQHKIQ